MGGKFWKAASEVETLESFYFVYYYILLTFLLQRFSSAEIIRSYLKEDMY